MKARLFVLRLAAAVSVYALVYAIAHDQIQVPFSLGAQKYTVQTQMIITALPLWTLVCFGAYTLATIGYALCTFRECKDASIALKTVF